MKAKLDNNVLNNADNLLQLTPSPEICNVHCNSYTNLDRKVQQYQERLSLELGSLITDEDDLPLSTKFIKIPEYDLKLSAGNGFDVIHEEIKKWHLLSKEILGLKLHNEKGFCIFTVKGESMSPTILDGAKVIVNLGQTEVIDGKIYALCKNNEIFIKRLFREAGTNNYEARSDNQMYNKVYFGENDDVRIIGRAVLSLCEL
jgi:phage repressor protein C with HTH and peptisase S24 domain